jgi:hypothetical protein
MNRACAINRLDGIQQEIQEHLVHLIAIMLHVREARTLHELDLDGLGQNLLTRQHDRVLDGDVQIAGPHLGRMGTGTNPRIAK